MKTAHAIILACLLPIASFAGFAPRMNTTIDASAQQTSKPLSMAQAASQDFGFDFTNLQGSFSTNTDTVVMYYTGCDYSWQVAVTGSVEDADTALVSVDPAHSNTNTADSGAFPWRLEVARSGVIIAKGYGSLVITKSPVADGTPVLVTTTNINVADYTVSGAWPVSSIPTLTAYETASTNGEGTAGQVFTTDGSGSNYWSASGIGDMVAANNLSDVASASTSLANLGGVPYVGATNTVDLNTNAVAGLSYTEYDITQDFAASIGRMGWDLDHGMIGYYVSADVFVGIGDENIRYVRNVSGSTMTNGFVVRQVGGTGHNPDVDFALATSVTNATVYGMITSPTIADNDWGWCVRQGRVHTLETAGIAEGAIAYLSPVMNDPGTGYNWATNKLADGLSVKLGLVVDAHASQGIVDFWLVPVLEPDDVFGLGTAATNNTGDFATPADLANYLPLTGGTLTGTLDAGTNTIKADIFVGGGDAYYFNTFSGELGLFGFGSYVPYMNISSRSLLLDWTTTNIADSANEIVSYSVLTNQGYVAAGDDADTLGSGAATDGQVLTADGAGNAAWEDAGGESVTNTVTEVMTNQVNFPAGIQIDGVPITSVETNSAIAFEVGLSGNQTGLASSTDVTIEFDTVNFDTTGSFNTTTHLYQAPKIGYYDIGYTARIANIDDTKNATFAIRQGGDTSLNRLQVKFSRAANATVTGAAEGRFYAPSTNTYWYFTITHDNGDTTPAVWAGSYQTSFHGHYIGGL